MEAKLIDISSTLDNCFHIDDCPKDSPFADVFPDIYKKQGIKIENYVVPKFLGKYHGLMIVNSQIVRKIIGTVFFNREIIEKIVSEGETDLLIFSHHPMEDETSGQGFTALKESHLLAMRQNRISAYSLHTPLDTNDQISTTRSISSKLSLVNCKPFANTPSGYMGCYGEIGAPQSFTDFLSLARKIFQIDELHWIKNQNTVKRIGIIPGGGTDVNSIIEAQNIGCDTYLTGEYYCKLQNAAGEKERQIFDRTRSQITMNMVETSHYATEKLVLINELADFFKNLSIPYQFIEQEDPWY